jgi:hypothetical protein
MDAPGMEDLKERGLASSDGRKSPPTTQGDYINAREKRRQISDLG